MLRPHCLGIDLNARHGALLAVAEVVHALAEHARRHGQPATQHIGTAGPGVDWGEGWGRYSVRKVVSRSKFTEQIFTPEAEQNFEM